MRGVAVPYAIRATDPSNTIGGAELSRRKDRRTVIDMRARREKTAVFVGTRQDSQGLLEGFRYRCTLQPCMGQPGQVYPKDRIPRY